jgi:Rrf2 family protein
LTKNPIPIYYTVPLGKLGSAAMKLSTTVRYGARAMTQVAAAYPDRAVSVREVGEEQNISPKYLEHILRGLKAAGLVRAIRGTNGGYVLARPPGSITLKDLYESLVGSVAPVDCVDCPDSCSMHDICPTRDTWVEMKEAIETVLERTTIRDLVERKKRKAISSAPTYQI